MAMKKNFTYPRLSLLSLRGSKFNQPLAFVITFLLSALLAVACQGTFLAGMAQGQTITSAKIQDIVDGTEVYIQNRLAKVQDTARNNQRVRTGNARTELLLNNKAVIRLAKNSALTVGQCANLAKGSLMISGKVNGCTTNITTGVRGTTYVIGINDDGKEEVQVLEGEVAVIREDKVSALNNSPLATTETFDFSDPTTKDKQFTSGPSLPPNITVNNRPTLPNSYGDLFPKANQDRSNGILPRDDRGVILETRNLSREVILKAGQKVELDVAGGILSAIQTMSQKDFEQVLQGNLFQGFQNQIPGIDKVRDTFQNLFPGADFPISLPRIPTPNLPSLPSLPSLPF